jgi:AcrR family transcriptional regulator
MRPIVVAAHAQRGFVRMFNKFVHASNPPMPARRAAALAPEGRPDRKAAILLAAEKLFAQQGYDVVTIRQIAEEAGVPLALVGYYYGQKHELFEAAFAHWQDTIAERLDGLRHAQQAREPERLGAIVEAFVAPVLRLRASAEGEYYALMVARELYHARPHTDRVLREFFDPMAHAFIDALHAALPHASRADAAWCYQFMLGALLHHISDDRVERLSHGQCRAADPVVAPMLNRFILGGIQAALPAPPRSLATTTPRRLR